MESSSTFSSSPSISPTLLGDVESRWVRCGSGIEVITAKLCRRTFATFTNHTVLSSKQENLVTSLWIVAGRRHSGNSFLFIPFARKKDIHKFRRDKTIEGSFYWKFTVCSAWTNGRVGEMLSFFHDRSSIIFDLFIISTISLTVHKR